MKNLGWMFYKTYYDLESLQKRINEAQLLPFENGKSEKDVEDETIERFFGDRNNMLFKEKFEPNEWLKVVPDKKAFKLTTTYPGLLSGSGVMHETGKLNELKLGFCFDHTTGLPYLPGSTVKGAIRQVFPNHLRKKANKEKELKARQRLLEKADLLEIFCIDLFKKQVNTTITPAQLLQFEWLIFENRSIENIDDIISGNEILFQKIKDSPIGIYESDVFHDAFIFSSNHKGKLFLGNDFITPHKNPLKNPTPIQFLKVLPNVVWAFQFDLKESTVGDLKITADKKLALFKEIITDLGIGAKTNVGYGRLIE